MRIIPIILCGFVVTVITAPNPERYSSSHYQFERSASAYRNNELQHKTEETGAYGRIENPDKYEQPLERSHYRRSSYNAPGAESMEDNSEEEKPYNFGVKGGRHNSHNSYGVYRPTFYHPPGFNNLPESNNGYREYHHNHGHGYHQHGHEYHHQGHGYHRHHGHGIQVQDTNQNKDEQPITLDTTFDYSKFNNQGSGREYLENTEGGSFTTPKTTTTTTTIVPNIKPIFETIDESLTIPEQPGSSSQTINTNGGQTINQGSTLQQGQTIEQGQTLEQEQDQMLTTIQTFDTDMEGQQQQTVPSFMEMEKEGDVQTNMGQSQTNMGQTQEHLKPFFDQIDQIHKMQSWDHTMDQGNREIMHHTTGYIKPKYEMDFSQHNTDVDEPDCGPHHRVISENSGMSGGGMESESHYKPEESTSTKEPVAETTRVITNVPIAETTRVITNVPIAETTRVMTDLPAEEVTTQMVPITEDVRQVFGGGNSNGGGFEVAETTTKKYVYQYTRNYHDGGYYGQQREDGGYYGQQREDGGWDQVYQEDLTQQQEDLTQQQQKWDELNQQQEDLTQQQQKWDQLNQQQDDLTQQHEDLTQQHEDLTQQQQKWDQLNQQQEDLTQQQEDLTQQHEDLTQQQQKWDQFNQQQGGDLTQQQENNWGQLQMDHEDLSQVQQKPEESYGRLEFGGQQREQDQDQQQVQKIHDLGSEYQQETVFETEPKSDEEVAIVVEEKPTQKPGFWQRFRGSVSRTYQSAKEKLG